MEELSPEQLFTMRHCPHCNKHVNANRSYMYIGVTKLWSDHCEECGIFIAGGVVPELNKGKKEDVLSEM